ncbi:NAD(P)-binding domain-containing protein [Kineosporia sp. J2-2]|uniref:NAD(P)-binding domain-containing protein n=1 Tax=Kineosporia corallincola TaxID=2835133 RepID=A0ABS5TST1_9ACTN|nr:NAD(P)-binding domain-containing protein [Kineosporia corallincola]MBT0773872.1 NAD(P)-binding domain-containing protein [Kineosporia corallincola]
MTAAIDYLIIGAGPAGLQLAARFQHTGRDYLVLEAGPGPGTFFRTYPRHRQLISINKRHTGSDDPEFNLRMDWNSLLSDRPDPDLRFTSRTRRYFPAADDLVGYLEHFAEQTGVQVRYDTRVDGVSRQGDEFEVRSGDQTWRAKRLIVATGVSQLNVPQIEGIETVEHYDTVSVDPDDFIDQRVLIIGKGNSAFETADNLVETTSVLHVAGPNSLKLAWRTHFVGHLRAVNNNFLDTYQLKSQNAILDGDVQRIRKNDDGTFTVTFSFARVNEVHKDLTYDRVILAAGFRFDASIFDEDSKPDLVIRDRFPAQTSAWESVNVPGLYIAGTLSQMRDFKKSTSGFIHGFRYAVRALSRILDQRYEGQDWPSTELAAEPVAITDAVIARVNRTSALWQQFGVLADVVTVDGGQARYLEEVPVDYFREGGVGVPEHAFVVTLEYGPDHDQVDPFDIDVARIAQDEPGQAHDAAYLHPVVRHYRKTGGAPELVATHHLAENLENEWNRPAVHQEPLTAFLAHQLEVVGAGH